MNRDRLAIVSSLIDFSASLESIQQAISKFDWDCHGNTLKLHPAHIGKVLRRYLIGEITVETVEQWANMIEGREDIDLEDGSEGWVGEVLHELANPLLTKILDRERAKQILETQPE